MDGVFEKGAEAAVVSGGGRCSWVPAFAGMTLGSSGDGVTPGEAGVHGRVFEKGAVFMGPAFAGMTLVSPQGSG